MYKHRAHTSARKRVLFSLILFILFLTIFKEYIFATRCPAISCDAPTGCVGACYSSVNALPFALILAFSFVIPVAIYRTYRKIHYHP